jgi:hypothetical protein
MSAKGIPVAEFQRVQDELIALKEELYTFKERDKRLTKVDRRRATTPRKCRSVHVVLIGCIPRQDHSELAKKHAKLEKDHLEKVGKLEKDLSKLNILVIARS